MRVTLDLPDDVVDRMQREADRRAMSLDALVSEWAYQLPEALTEAATGEVRRLGFFALGSSTNGRSAVDADEMLAEGFGRD